MLLSSVTVLAAAAAFGTPVQHTRPTVLGRMPAHSCAEARARPALVASAVPAVAAVSPASAATSRSFPCQGTISRNYTLQKVTGTLTGATPSNVTVRNYVDRVLVTSQAPSLDNA